MEKREMETEQRPQKVVNACKLLAVMLLIGALRGFIDFALNLTVAPIRMVIIGQMIIIVLTGLNIYLILIRKNWARILYAVMFVTGLPMSIKPTLMYMQSTPITGILVIIQIVLQIIALVYLFSNESNQWFRKKEKQKESKME